MSIIYISKIIHILSYSHYTYKHDANIHAHAYAYNYYVVSLKFLSFPCVSFFLLVICIKYLNYCIHSVATTSSFPAAVGCNCIASS